MTTDPTPSPDVRELAAEITHARLGTSEPWSESPDWIRNLYREVADAVLAAVSPALRRQERAAVAEEIDGLHDWDNAGIREGLTIAAQSTRSNTRRGEAP